MKSSLRIAFRFTLLALLLVTGAACRKKNPNPLSDPALGGMDGLPMDGALLGGDLDGGALAGRGAIENMSPVDSSAYAPVYFSFDSSAIASGEMAKVQAVAGYLLSNNRDAVIVQGHTDERGSREYNLSLGERRALAVRESLIVLGVSAEQIQTLSYGEEQPSASGSGEAVWSLNRRADFQLMR